MDVVVNAPHLPALDETVAGNGVTYQFGGKGGNQAVAAARFGAKTAMAGRVGADEFAEHLLAHLDESGVERSQVQQGAGASGMSVAIVNSKGGYGAVTVSAANLEIELGKISIPRGTKILILQNEVPEALNIALAKKAKRAGISIILNAAPAREMEDELVGLLDMLIVNRGEASLLCNQGEAGLNPADAAMALHQKGARQVIITLGEEGLVFVDEGKDVLEAAAFGVDVISSHGAGDAFTGALAACLATGRGTHQAIRFAQGAAALHVSTPVEKRCGISITEVERLAGLGACETASR
ncbi:MAG TPA: ribokinase [Devosia sp.]|nr:ribokinase [Devosia sp.]